MRQMMGLTEEFLFRVVFAVRLKDTLGRSESCPKKKIRSAQLVIKAISALSLCCFRLDD
jgi:hypothetical protein